MRGRTLLKINGILLIDTFYSYWARRYLQISDDPLIPNRLCNWSILIKVRPISSGLSIFYPNSNVRSWPKTPVSDRFVGTNCTYPSYPPDSPVGPYQYRMSHIHLLILLIATPYLFLRYRTTANYPRPGHPIFILVVTPSVRKNSRWRSISEFVQHLSAWFIVIMNTVLVSSGSQPDQTHSTHFPFVSSNFQIIVALPPRGFIVKLSQPPDSMTKCNRSFYQQGPPTFPCLHHKWCITPLCPYLNDKWLVILLVPHLHEKLTSSSLHPLTPS